jgi:hypothetical protein
MEWSTVAISSTMNLLLPPCFLQGKAFSNNSAKEKTVFVMKQALEVSTFLVQDLHWLKQRLWLCWQPLPIKMEIQSLMLV